MSLTKMTETLKRHLGASDCKFSVTWSQLRFCIIKQEKWDIDFLDQLHCPCLFIPILLRNL